MHKESFKIVSSFVKKFLDPEKNLKILEVGSYDVNGSFKNLFKNPKWKYYGLDLRKGSNVDIVSKGPYDFGLNEKFDVIISANCLEHVEAPWKWIKEIERVTKKNGLICITVPFSIGEHKHPLDCWRILPDGFKYLLEKHCDFKILKCELNEPLAWLPKKLPVKIKKIFEIPIVKDTYAIAIKN